MPTRHTASTFLAAFGLTTALSVTTALAGAFGISEQSTYGLGMAQAGVAAGGSLSTSFWNPATISETNGLTIETDLSAILPFIHVTTNAFTAGGNNFPAQNQGNIGIGVVVPATYLAYRVNPNIVLGLGINSPFGLATRYDPTASFMSLTGIASGSRIFSVNVNPNIAYQINDQLAVAVGLQGQYMELHESGFLRPTGNYIGHTNDIGLGFTLGAEYKPMKGTTLGIGYRSGITNTLNGTLSGVPAPPTALAGTLKVKTPGTLSVGISQDIGEAWTLKAGAAYSNWSVLDSVPVSGPASAIITQPLPFKYQDGWMYSIGGEYKYSPDLTLRSGIGYEISPINTAARNFRLPDSDRLWLSAGLSYNIAKGYTVDAGYSFLHAMDNNINSFANGGPQSNGPASGTVVGNIHILSVALKAKFN